MNQKTLWLGRNLDNELSELYGWNGIHVHLKYILLFLLLTDVYKK